LRREVVVVAVESRLSCRRGRVYFRTRMCIDGCGGKTGMTMAQVLKGRGGRGGR
jgi:hypothetical protein